MLLTKTLKSTLFSLTTILALGASSAVAATNSIEGVWSLSGGAIAIQAQPNGTFHGTVVSPTMFGSCPHPEGEEIWTQMEPQIDGSFLGLHQWYKGEGATCIKDPTLGHTAWRVLTNSSGARILKVCFNNPGDEAEPMIALDGAPNSKAEDGTYQVTYGCYESSPLEAVSTVEGEGAGKGGSSGSGVITFGKTVTLPPATACVSQSSLKIKLKDPKYDPLKQVVVKIGSKQLADIKGIKALAKALKKGIALKNLPSGSYKINVTATTVLKQQLTGSQTYKACATGSGNIKLKKTHHHG